jgi:hypothetical protein
VFQNIPWPSQQNRTAVALCSAESRSSKFRTAQRRRPQRLQPLSAAGEAAIIDHLPNKRLAAGLQRSRNLYMPLAYGHINRVVQNRLRHADIAMMFEQPIHIFRAPQRNHPYQHPLKLDSIHTNSLSDQDLVQRIIRTSALVSPPCAKDDSFSM